MQLVRILLIAAIICTCTPLHAQDSVRISGKITHPTSDTIEVTYNGNNLAYYPEHHFARLDQKGNFSLKFPFPPGKFIQTEIRYADHIAEVLLSAGQKLALTVNTDHFDSTIHYAGKGSDIQNFIAKHTLAKGRMNQYNLKLRTAMTEEPNVFLEKIEQEYQSEEQFLHNYPAKLPPNLVAYWLAFYKYYNYFFMQQYPQSHQYVKLRRYTDTIPMENYTVVSRMPLAFGDSLLQVPTYLLYLTGVFDAKLRAAGYMVSGKDTSAIRVMEDSLYNIAFNLLPDKSAEFYMAQSLYGRARIQRLERTLNQLTSFKQHWPNSTYLPLLTKQVATAQRLSPGQPAPDFNFTNPDGKKTTLSDLKGKVVYLGFWAGWCRQCVGEMLQERKIKDLLHNKPLEFVYVSLGSDTASEAALIDKYRIEGNFTTAPGGWDAKEVADYGVQSLPAYYLIDQQGNFVRQFTPSPAQTMELVMAIEQLFK